jgi:dTDP-4-dehydrorhamnose 3,5-epimerase
MPDITESPHIAGVHVVEPTIHGDQRGLFIETFRREWIPGAREMIQSNRANRQQGAVVGLHDRHPVQPSALLAGAHLTTTITSRV